MNRFQHTWSRGLDLIVVVEPVLSQWLFPLASCCLANQEEEELGDPPYREFDKFQHQKNLFSIKKLESPPQQ